MIIKLFIGILHHPKNNSSRKVLIREGCGKERHNMTI